MIKGTPVKVAAAVAVLALATAMAPPVSDYLPVGSEAPAFEIVAADGQTYSLKSLTEKAPVFLVFWKERCPHNRRATPLFNAMKEAYGDKVTLLGIVKASLEGAKSWVDQFSVRYPLLPDADGSLVEGYQLTYSITSFEIGTDGKIAKVFEGYGYDAMSSLNRALAAAVGADAAEIDLSGAPPRQTWG